MTKLNDAHIADNHVSAHPSTTNRVRRLREMAGSDGPWDNINER